MVGFCYSQPNLNLKMRACFWQARVLFTCIETLAKSLVTRWFWVSTKLNSCSIQHKSQNIIQIDFVNGGDNGDDLGGNQNSWIMIFRTGHVQPGRVTKRCFLSDSFRNEFDDTQALVKMIDRNVITKGSSNLVVGFSLHHWSTRQVAN